MIVPARRLTLHEVISKQIIALIQEGEWKLGDKIPGELSLSGQFEVSRNSIRESIKALELVGLLRSSPGKGTYVSENALERIIQLNSYNHDDQNIEDSLIELFEVRLVVEPGLCWLAAQNGKAKHIKKMEEIIIESLNAADHNEYHFDLGMAFHESLYYSSENKHIINIFSSMKSLLGIARKEVYFKITKKEILVKELHEHLEIFNLIKDRKGEEASFAMRNHLESSLKRLKSLVKKDINADNPH